MEYEPLISENHNCRASTRLSGDLGLKLHAIRGEVPCELCVRKAYDYRLAREDEFSRCEIPTKNNPFGHAGTMVGIEIHHKRKEPICQKCKEYWLTIRGADAYSRLIRRSKHSQTCQYSTAWYPRGRRGTLAGYRAHQKEGELPCEECKKAYRKYQRDTMRKSIAKKRNTGEEGIYAKTQKGWRTVEAWHKSRSDSSDGNQSRGQAAIA